MSTNRPRRIDRDTAEQLLAGAVGGPSAGPGASLTGPDGSTGRTGSSRSEAGPGDRVARVLAAAAAPATGGELAGEEAALAAFREARLASAAVPAAPAPVRRRSMATATLTRAFSTKAAAVVLGATALGGVAVAAGTGNLPVPLGGGSDQPHRAVVAPNTSAPSATTATRSEAPAARPTAPPSTPGPTGGVSGGASSGSPSRPGTASGGPATADPTTAEPSGPEKRPKETPTRTPGEGRSSSTPAVHAALCKLFADRAGKGERPRLLVADPQFGALVAAAGGPDKVADYCVRALRGAGDDDHQDTSGQGPGSGASRPGSGSGSGSGSGRSGGSGPGGGDSQGDNSQGSGSQDGRNKDGDAAAVAGGSGSGSGPGDAGTGGNGDGGSVRTPRTATAPPAADPPGGPAPDRTVRPDSTPGDRR
ncbi:hypothetical protein [Kitasatospora purpeofusca]|uniref:Uncharacterized protein n=1 Tax=Kitasatospora purpeofusca TaxID=67352 RepID=A0ABZ1U3Z9_9ACTN|nr:hypothetical protein [Kitasatospora purpeofusca]